MTSRLTEARKAFDLELIGTVQHVVHVLNPDHFPGSCPIGALCGPRGHGKSINFRNLGWQ